LLQDQEMLRDRLTAMIDPTLNDSPSKPMSPWQHKPWWCQPWSILLTGIVLISGSWFALKLVWLTVLVAIPVCCWMGFFLLLWPKLMMEHANLQVRQNVE
jgi:hypothetical protein